LPENYTLSDIEFIDIFYKLLPLIFSILGASFAYFLFCFNLSSFYIIKQTKTFKLIYNFLNRKWYFDRVYNQFLGQNSLSLGYHHTYKDIDRGIIEVFGPFGITRSTKDISLNIKQIQTGFLYHYLFLFLVFIVLFVLIIVLFSLSNMIFSSFLFLSFLIIFEIF